MKKLFIVLLSLILFISVTPQETLASTYGDNLIPWGSKNNYRGFDGTDFIYMLTVDPFTLQANSTDVDMVSGTGAYTSSGITYYPLDPTAYYTGFNLNTPLTFNVTLHNYNSTPNGSLLDNFFTSPVDGSPAPAVEIWKVISCNAGTDINSNSLSELDLATNCVGALNQQLVSHSSSLQGVNIDDNNPPVTISYTWTPTETGYYQFDFNSDDYGDGSNCDVNGLDCGPPVSGTASHIFHSGFVKIINSTPTSTPIPTPTPSTPYCQVTGAACGSATTTSITINNMTRTDTGWGSRGFYVQSSGLPNRFLLDPINSYSATGLTANTPYTFNISCAYQQSMGYQTTGTFPLSCSTSANPPTINSLQVNSASTTFSGTYGVAGRQTIQNGSNWLNPMVIRLNATPSTGSMALYSIAFYDKNQGQSTAQSTLGSLASIEGRVDVDNGQGFILAYAIQDCTNKNGICPVDSTNYSFSANNYYAYVKGSGWVNITSYYAPGYFSINDNSNNLVFKVTPNPDGYNFWQVAIDQNFGGISGYKSLYTAVYAVNSANAGTFEVNRAPQINP